MLKLYLDLMLHGSRGQLSCNEDQPQLNWMTYTGVFKREKLAYKIVGPETILSMSSGPYEMSVSYNLAQALRTPSGKIPVLAHQYNRSPQTKTLPVRLCRVNEFMRVWTKSR